MIFKRLMMLAMIFCFLSACAPAKQVVKERYFWPPPPDEPRIEFLGAYYSENDLPGGSNFTLFQTLVGADAELTFQSPLNAASNSEGWLVVSDPTNRGFISVDLKARKFSVLGGAAMTQVVKPTGVDFDAEGLVYAGDDISRKIYVVSRDNKVQRVLDLSKDLKSVGSFTIDKKLGRIIIPDATSNAVAIFTTDGKLLKSFGKKGGMDGEFNYPISAALDSRGNIFVTDSFNAQVQKFTSEGVFISKFGKRGDAAGDFGIIKGIAIDSDDNIYVSDGKFHRVLIFNSEGALLMSLGSAHGQRPGESIIAAGFLLPFGVYIDKKNQIFVADMMNRRLQVFQYFPEKKPVK